MQPLFRVVHLVSGDAWGGLEAMVLDLLSSETYRQRVDATIVALNEGMFASRARAKGLRVLVVPESNGTFLSLRRALKSVIHELEPDIVHTHRYKEILLGAMLSPASVHCHAITIHGYEPPASLFTRFKSAISNSLCIGAAVARGGRFIVVADHLRARFRIPRRRCVTIHNGIQIPQRARGDHEHKKSDCSQEDHSQKQKVVIGWVGRMVPVKGLSTLLKAVAEMDWTPPPVLLLVGDGPERTSLELLAKSLGIAERTRFQGFVDNPQQFYNQMDLFALPSHHEGIPMVLLEALGSGLPVVASSVGGIPQVIEAGETGVLLESRSPSVWAKTLTDLLKDRDRMKSLGERARTHIQANFSVDGMASRYVAVYESMRA